MKPRIWHVGDPIPKVLNDALLMQILGYGKNKFYAMKAAQKFVRFELELNNGNTEYSGAKVARYLDGEPVTARRHLSSHLRRTRPGRPRAHRSSEVQP